MSTNVTLSLPDEVFERATHLAELTGCELPAILADTLAASLSLLGAATSPAAPLLELSDDAVIALAALSMDATQDERLSELLDRQQAGEIRAEERVELLGLLQVYQEGTLRKAQGLREAVRRGLRKPLDP